MSQGKDRHKLANNVSRMIGALKAKASESGISPPQPALAAPAPAANRTSSNSANVFRTPSRDRFSSPGTGSNFSSDEELPFDGKSFNRSRRGSGDRTSQASLLDLHDDTHDVFNQPGFGALVQSVEPVPQPQRKPLATSESVPKPKPQPRREQGGGGGHHTSSSRMDGAQDNRRTPHRSSSRNEHGDRQRRPDDRPPHRDAPRDSQKGTDPRATPPISSRSDTPLERNNATAPQQRPLHRPKREEEYQASDRAEVEKARRQQLNESGASDVRRSAPRRSESPRADAAGTGDGRSRSTQKLRDATRRLGNVTPVSRRERPSGPSADGSQSAKHHHQQQQPAPSTSNPPTPMQESYQLPKAYGGGAKTRSPPQATRTSPVTAMPPSTGSALVSPISGSVSPPAAQGTTLLSVSQQQQQQQQRVSSPAVGIRRKNTSGGLGNSSSTNSKVSPPNAPSPLSTAGARGGGSGLNAMSGVTKALANLSQNTTRHMLGNAQQRSMSPQDVDRTLTPRTEARNGQPSQAAFSLADFVKETSSQYDFNRAPSRMSWAGGSQYGGSQDGVSTPVQMRGANLLDSLSEAKYPARAPPTSTAGMIDSSWLDQTTKHTTSGGIDKTEKSVRLRIQHAALFRPRVWFLNNILPNLRQHYLREYALQKRKLFVSCAEPVFRHRFMEQEQHAFELLKCEYAESVDRLDLARASILWRTQVKGAFDRLVQQLKVEQVRKVETVQQTAEADLVKGASALMEKTSFSYLHLHTQFGEALLKRTKELYIYYFGIMASMGVKEERQRAAIASEQRFQRMHIELDRLRFFIQHLELVEYENILKYFAGEKRILESELRFKPKAAAANQSGRMSSNSGAFAQNTTPWKSSAAVSVTATPVPFGIRSGASSPLMEDYARQEQQQQQHYMTRSEINATPHAGNYSRSSNMSGAIPVQQQQQPYHQQQQHNSNEPPPPSPFPLDALERQQSYRRSQTQQLENAAAMERELQGTPAAFRGPTSGDQRFLSNTADSSYGRSLAHQQQQQQQRLPPVKQEQPLPPVRAAPQSVVQHEHPLSYQQSNPMQQLRSFQEQQLAAAQRATLERMAPPVTSTSLRHNSSSTASHAQSSSSRLGKQFEHEEANFGPVSAERNGSVSQLPPIRRGTPVMGVEDKRRSDEEEDVLLPAPIRGGHLLPRIDPALRKAREHSEGVVQGIMLVNKVLSSDSSGSLSGKYLPPLSSSGTASVAGTTAAALSADTTGVVNTVGRMLLGSDALPSISAGAAAGSILDIPEGAIDDRRVWLAELDTAVALLLMLHKSGVERIAEDERGVRCSLAFYAQEDKKDAVTRSAATRTSRFFATRTEKLVVEEQELRTELAQQEAYEFALQIQRRQWVEYFLLTTEEASDRERIVGMSHLSRAIVERNSKQEFGITCLMQHQVLALQQFHAYQRWFFTDCTTPTAVGLAVYQTERRERNKLMTQMEKEGALLSKDARERRAHKALYTGVVHLNPVEVEALTSVEEVHRRNLERQFMLTREVFIFESWEEPMQRGVLVVARERWFRDLVRPSQHRISISVSETAQRSAAARSESEERAALETSVLRGLYEAHYQDNAAAEQREFRKLTMVYLKERRQRELRERESASKKFQLEKYLTTQQKQQQHHSGASPHHSDGSTGRQTTGSSLDGPLTRYMAATTAVAASAPAADGIGSVRSTPLPDYSAMLLRSKKAP